MTGAVREYTTYFDFEIPSFDFPGWHTYYDRNIKTMDSILYLVTGTSNLRGTWKNSTLYHVGDRVIDVELSQSYECFVEHTSAAAPTLFAQDRSAPGHGAYWQQVNVVQSLTSTSSSAATIGAGIKTFTTQTGRLFTLGSKVIITSAANPTVDYMWGAVTSYSGTTLIVDASVASGSGVHSDWLISVSGERGIQGPTGPTGATGETGATGATGVGIIWRGTWSSVTPYVVDDAVQHLGASYVAVAANTNSAPPSANWNLIAQAGGVIINPDSVTPAMLDAGTSPKQIAFRDRLNFLSRAGDTMTAALTLPAANPTTPQHAAHKQYVDDAIANAIAALVGTGNELRFTRTSSQHMTRLFATTSSLAWTLSLWVKRVGLASRQALFGIESTTGAGKLHIEFDTSNQLSLYAGAAGDVALAIGPVYNSTTLWYNIVWSAGAGTPSSPKFHNLYVNNGSAMTGLIAGNDLNTTVTHYIGQPGMYPDVIMKDVVFVDGAALTPTAFGEDVGGVWTPKVYGGPFGTNGFKLHFNPSNKGDDITTNNNDWTPVNF